MREHYESYRESIRKTALEGFADYAKKTPTAKPEQWPTVFDYLRNANDQILASLEEPELYKKKIRNHQEGMLALFRKMAKEACTGITVLDLIHTRGWKWFKYTDQPIVFEKQVWVPRYETPYYEGRVHFDADELQILFQTKPPKNKLDLILEVKRRRPEKLLTSEVCVPLGFVNHNGVVRDWTMELFP